MTLKKILSLFTIDNYMFFMLEKSEHGISDIKSNAVFVILILKSDKLKIVLPFVGVYQRFFNYRDGELGLKPYAILFGTDYFKGNMENVLKKQMFRQHKGYFLVKDPLVFFEDMFEVSINDWLYMYGHYHKKAKEIYNKYNTNTMEGFDKIL